MFARVDFSSTFVVVLAGRAWCVTLAHTLKVADATVAFLLCRMGKPQSSRFYILALISLSLCRIFTTWVSAHTWRPCRCFWSRGRPPGAGTKGF